MEKEEIKKPSYEELETAYNQLIAEFAREKREMEREAFNKGWNAALKKVSKEDDESYNNGYEDAINTLSRGI